MANVFQEKPASRLSVKIPLNQDGNIAQGEETAVKQKTVSIKGFINNGSLSKAADVMDVFLGTIANTTYDSVSAVRTDTAEVGEGLSQSFSLDNDSLIVGTNVGATKSTTAISRVPNDTPLNLIVKYQSDSAEWVTVETNDRTITVTRIKEGFFNTFVYIKSDEVAGYAASGDVQLTISGE